MCLWAQDLSPFGALRLPVDAAVAALGDYNVSHTGKSTALMWQNPALVSAAKGTQLSTSFIDYYADIHAASTSFRFSKGAHAFGAGIRYLSYGKIDGYDEKGVATGKISASVQLMQLTYGHNLGPFSVAVSLLPAYATLADASAFALFSDLGVTFTHPRHELRVGLSLKHMPLLRLSGTLGAEQEEPLDVWLGATYRPERMPFRFSLTGYGLTKNTYYEDNESPIKAHHSAGSLAEKIFGKCNLGTELLIAKWVQLQGALTVARQQQLQTNEANGWAGFSFGCAVKIHALALQLTRSFHDIRGGRTHIGLQLNFDVFRIKRKRTYAE